MRTVSLRVTQSHVNELWLTTDSDSRLLAREGAFGLRDMGWHSHSGLVVGDWATVEDVLTAYHIAAETLH